ncbi:carboxylesterase, partial [Rhizoctonia solani AG-3 Rhs1AP]
MPSVAFWTRTVLALGGTLATAQTTAPTIKGNGVAYIGGRDSPGGTDHFLSIPFAQPPTGSLRFKPPVAWAPSSSDQTINATVYGPSCPQGLANYVSSASEDCLTLDIWKPTNITEKLPVMVWIYGGGFYFGTSQGYEGWYMVQPSIPAGKPFIYVALNYRTGLFGCEYIYSGNHYR